MMKTASIFKQREKKMCCIHSCIFVFVLKNEHKSLHVLQLEWDYGHYTSCF